MIPRSQHFRDRAPFPFDRSGELRILEKLLFEALLMSAFGRAHYAGKQANASIEYHQRGRLSAGQDDVAHGDLLDRAPVEDSFAKPQTPNPKPQTPNP